MLKLYGKYFAIHLKSAMQFKGSFFTSLIAQFLTSFSVFLGISFMFQRFHRVADFTYEQVLLCYGIMLMGFSMAQLFASGFKVFDSMIANGEFDRILCRPRNEIFQASRLQLLHKTLHAALFQLEHRVGIPVRNQFVSFGIVALLTEFDLIPRVLVNIVERLFDIGERRQRKEVHFQHADGFDFLHVELRRDILSVPRKRHVVRNPFTAYNDACGMHARLARHAFKPQSHVDHAFQRFVRFVYFNEFRVSLPLLIGEFFPGGKGGEEAGKGASEGLFYKLLG